MTERTLPDYEHEEFYASRKPVQRFVAALTAVVGMLLLIWWAGLLAPRLSADVSSGRFDSTTRSGSVEIDLRNEGPLPVRIQQVEFNSGIEVRRATIRDTSLDHRPEISGNSTATLSVDYGADHCVTDARAGVLELRLQVRTTAGVVRNEQLYAPLPTSGSTSC